jgi:hypothetical protein
MSSAGQNFDLGAKVYLKTCPNAGEPGTVTGKQRGRILVDWPDLGHSTRHRPEALELAKEHP